MAVLKPHKLGIEMPVYRKDRTYKHYTYISFVYVTSLVDTG